MLSKHNHRSKFTPPISKARVTNCLPDALTHKIWFLLLSVLAEAVVASFDSRS
jgi:hypothetical protein